MSFNAAQVDRLLAANNLALESYIVDQEPDVIFAQLLDGFLELSDSKLCLLARVVRHNENLPHIRPQATNIPFINGASDYFASPIESSTAANDDLRKLLHSLVKRNEPVLFNASAESQTSIVCPQVSDSLTSFIGLPISWKGNLSAVVCLFNRPGGYQSEWVNLLNPLGRTFLQLSQALESDLLQAKLATEINRQHELRYQALFQLSPDAIVTTTATGALEYNRAAQLLFGISPEEPLNTGNLRDFVPKHQPDGRLSLEAIQQIAQQCETTGPLTLDWTFCRRNGDLFPAEVAVATVPVLKGQTVFQMVIRDQSKLKLQEQRLRLLHEQRQEILDSSPMGIAITRINTGEIIFANQAAKAIFDIPEGGIADGQLQRLWVDPNDRLKFHQSLQRTGKAQGEVQLFTLNGRVIQCMLTWQWNPGKTDEVLSWFVDVTQIKAIEDSLVQQEALQKVILDQLPLALFCKDISNDFRYTLCNQKFFQMYSADADEWIGKSDFDIYTHGEAALERRRDLQVIASGRPLITTDRYSNPVNSEMMEISTTKFCLPDISGKPMLLLGISEDVTERQEAERALQASERRFRQLAEHAPVGIFLADHNGACLFVNNHWQKMAGLDQEQSAGAGWKDAIYAEDLSTLLALWDEFLQGRSPFDLEYRLITPDGKVTWVHGSAVPFQADSGQILGYLGACSDITATKQYAAELAKSRDEAYRANQAKSEFLSRMSHELRTPLNAILGFGQLMQLTNGNLTSRQNQGVNHILNAGGLLLHMIEDILDLSRLDTGNVSLKLEATPINQCLKDSVALVQSESSQATIHVLHDQGDVSAVIADPRRLQQVLVNLLTNAVKHNPPDGEVTLSCSRLNERRIRIQVKDHGRGIPAGDQARIWLPFERYSGLDANTKGAGIGLSICKKLVEMMGGTIRFHSEVNKGSTFWIELLDAEPNDDFTSQLPDEIRRLSAGLQDLCIVCIEDNLSNRSFLSEIIWCLKGCEMHTAYSGKDGVALVKSVRPDLVLTGLNLPVMDGWQVLKALQNDERTHATPVIAMSVHGDGESRVRAMSAGFSGFVAKPVVLAQIIETMAAALGSSLRLP